MFEYILLIQVCSIIDKTCNQNRRYPKNIETHHECVIKGYDIGLEIAKSLNKEITNKKKIYVTFSCMEIEKINS